MKLAEGSRPVVVSIRRLVAAVDGDRLAPPLLRFTGKPGMSERRRLKAR